MEVVPTGQNQAKLVLNFHRGQKRAWESTKRIVLVSAGTQSGKTMMGPHWLCREMQSCGPGDYLVVCPTFKLMDKKVLPAFTHLFEDLLHYGDYRPAKATFELNARGESQLFGGEQTDRTKVFFGHAQDPDSLESATAKAAWLDEAGQNTFKLGSWEAVQRRLAIHQGRIFITTTPYNLGWLKQKIYDPWVNAKRRHQTIDVVNFRSIDNPVFPRAEYLAAKESLPGWKFRMFYDGEFDKPAGLIYDCFDVTVHAVPRFRFSDTWPRHLGLDFGGVNTAGVFLAEELASEKKTGRFFAYREYHEGNRTAAEHAKALKAGEVRIPHCVGGSKSEGQWRREFASSGLSVREPSISDVEVGINRVYGVIKRGELIVFDDLARTLDDLGTYSREVDENGEPTEKIADKETFHQADALRYILGYLRGGQPQTTKFRPFRSGT